MKNPVFLTIIMPKGKTQKAFYKHLVKDLLPMIEEDIRNE